MRKKKMRAEPMKMMSMMINSTTGTAAGMLKNSREG